LSHHATIVPGDSKLIITVAINVYQRIPQTLKTYHNLRHFAATDPPLSTVEGVMNRRRIKESAKVVKWRPCRAAALTFALLGGPAMPADAGGIEINSCFGSFHSFFCVTQWGPRGDPQLRHVPLPRNAEEEAEFATRDRKWVARCRPIITQDQYGVSR
jgi:hypothetical protein